MVVLRLVLVCVVCLTGVAAGGDWPQFLGLNRTGTSAETGLLKTFPSGGPQVVWKTALGTSMSGIAVSGEQAVTMFQDETQQFAVSLSANSGEVLWKTALAPAYENGMGNGPRATPTVSGGRVFAMTGEGLLVGLDAATGKLLWKVNVPQQFGGQAAEYGVSCSPLVAGDLVIVQAGSDSAGAIAVQCATGKLAWPARSGRSGYASPVLVKLAGRLQVVVFDGAGAGGLDPATGAELWQFPFPTEYDCNTACPVQVGENELLISSGENHGSVILQVTKSGGDLQVQPVWSSLGKDSQLRAEWQTPVVHEGHLYGLDNSGSAGPITNLVCIRLSDRKTVWQKSRFGKGNLILADGCLWITTMKGELVLAEAAAAGYRELGRATIMETTRQAPSLSGGRLYVRDDQHVICLGVSASR
ncbi:MAG: PQQ-binding-like beta-propeller repeat protein [Planctomycetaceae bacterium]